jgi:hypothetical protein
MVKPVDRRPSARFNTFFIIRKIAPNIFYRRLAGLTSAERNRLVPGIAGLRSAEISSVVAEVRGDVDAYMAHFDVQQLSRPTIAADVALHLLKVDRAEQALVVLDRAAANLTDWQLLEWSDARIAAQSSRFPICGPTCSGSMTLLTLRPRSGPSRALRPTPSPYWHWISGPMASPASSLALRDQQLSAVGWRGLLCAHVGR